MPLYMSVHMKTGTGGDPDQTTAPVGQCSWELGLGATPIKVLLGTPNHANTPTDRKQGRWPSGPVLGTCQGMQTLESGGGLIR